MPQMRPVWQSQNLFACVLEDLQGHRVHGGLTFAASGERKRKADGSAGSSPHPVRRAGSRWRHAKAREAG